MVKRRKCWVLYYNELCISLFLFPWGSTILLHCTQRRLDLFSEMLLLVWAPAWKFPDDEKCRDCRSPSPRKCLLLAPWVRPPSLQLKEAEPKVGLKEVVSHWYLLILFTEESWASLDETNRCSCDLELKRRILKLGMYEDFNTRFFYISCLLVCVRRRQSRTHVPVD